MVVLETSLEVVQRGTYARHLLPAVFLAMSRKKVASPVVVTPSQEIVISLEPVCLDIPQAAIFLATSTHQIRNLIRLRKLNAATLGKKLVLKTADLRTFAQSLVPA